MAANEIVELFCELIVTRLPIIAKQKYVLRTPFLCFQNYICWKPGPKLVSPTNLFCRECPADLKEGISSLIFAAPRCSELPELSRMRDLFEKKYGKDFVAAAVDLRPNASVNNLVSVRIFVQIHSLSCLHVFFFFFANFWNWCPSEANWEAVSQ